MSYDQRTNSLPIYNLCIRDSLITLQHSRRDPQKNEICALIKKLEKIFIFITLSISFIKVIAKTYSIIKAQ